MIDFHRRAETGRWQGLGVEYEKVDRDGGHEDAAPERLVHTESRAPSHNDKPPLPEYREPRSLTLEAEIKVPSRGLYRDEIERILRQFLFSSELFDASTDPELEVVEPARATLLSPFVCQVTYWLTRETIGRVEKQLRLFEET